jgi:hypothetical protein
MKELLDIFHHYYSKGNISTTTYKLIVQSIEIVEANEEQNRVILNSIHREIELMDQKIFDQYQSPGV